MVLRVVHGNDLFCIFNAIVDEDGVKSARQSLSRVKKVENPIFGKLQAPAESSLKPVEKQPDASTEQSLPLSEKSAEDSDDEDDPKLTLDNIYIKEPRS